MTANDNDDLLFISPEARDAHLCRKPVPSTVGNEPMVFNCLRFRGHDGPCKGAVVLRGTS